MKRQFWIRLFQVMVGNGERGMGYGVIFSPATRCNQYCRLTFRRQDGRPNVTQSRHPGDTAASKLTL